VIGWALVKYVTFAAGDSPAPRLGVVHGNQIIDLRSVIPDAPPTLIDLIRAGHSVWRDVAGQVEAYLQSSGASAAGNRGRGQEYPGQEVRWYPPIPHPPKNVFCVGRNYAGHAAESARARGAEVKIPKIPVFFTKAPTSVSGPFDDIPWDRSATQQVDWEAELGAIIGMGGRNIRKDDAMRHVFGYTVINDVTARDLQNSHGQWFKGKSLDHFCPMGPYVVTADEFGDPHSKGIALRVNGVMKQQGNTRDMIFPVDTLIESLSQGLTLEPGDIIATGTPDGVGFARTPPEFLQDGDIMETEVEGIGTLRNRVVADSR
jgi:2-keto-4-pentenoate hydratase/2-oxohepta-3-ene-1,7-dioic acid hydratase in catechol pathway